VWAVKFVAGQLLSWGCLLAMAGIFYRPVWVHFMLFWGLLQVPGLCAAPLIYLSNALRVSAHLRSLIFSGAGLVLFLLLFPLFLYIAATTGMLSSSSAKHYLPFSVGFSVIVSVQLYFAALSSFSRKIVER